MKYCHKRFRVSIVLILAIIIGCLISVRNAFATSPPALLPAEKAFSLKTVLRKDKQLELQLEIAPGYQLYKDHFKFIGRLGQKIDQSIFKLPLAILKQDEDLGNYQVYTDLLTLIVPVAVEFGTNTGFVMEYQGCSEGGFCFAPIAKDIEILPNTTLQVTDITPEQFNQMLENRTKAENRSDPANRSELDRIIEQLKNDSFPLALLSFLGLGLLLAFTPCVLPMVPILANILVGKNKPLTDRRAMLLTSLYVLSMALCYAIAGTIAGMMGSQLQMALQKPLFLVGLSFLLFIFALNQFNLLHIQLPHILTQFLNHLHNKQKQGSVFGAMGMGFLSALMISPCVTPALVGALTYIGQTGNAVLGGSALFAMALGMGLPLLIVACIGSHLLPKAGPWMDHIKILTGVLLIILAGSILMRAIPYTTKKNIETAAHFMPIHSEEDFNQAIQAARLLKKPVILDVYADWCTTCKQIDNELFNNEAVLSTLKNTALLRLDLSHQTKNKKAIQKRFSIIGPPTLIFFSHDGNEIKDFRLVGKLESNSFIEHVKRFISYNNQ